MNGGAPSGGWAFHACGEPAPQGSKTPKGRRKDGTIILVESSAKVKPWREAVKAAAIEQVGAAGLDGPLVVRMVFTVRRPTSARVAERYPSTRPDVSKLARSTEDAISDAGLWADDARVAGYARLFKVWPGRDLDALPVPGVVVACVKADGDDPGARLWALFRAEHQRACERLAVTR